jgi:hypothetical protein
MFLHLNSELHASVPCALMMASPQGMPGSQPASSTRLKYTQR